jgi:signal transduction histidine kinase
MEAIAGVALRVLQGDRADAVPTVSPNLNVLQVDWRELRRWGISESRVPAGTMVRFRQPTAWDTYGSYILAAVVVLLTQTLLIAGLLLQRTRRRRVEAQLRSQKLELRDSYERIRDINQRLLSAQDTERGRIARELHDDISQQVALLEIHLEQLNETVDADAGRLAGEALQRAEHIAKSVHDLSHRLHPAKLQLLGLLPALEGLRQELSRSDTVITFTHEGVAPALTPEETLCLFRVAQEALQNALKYSGSRRVSLDLRNSVDGLTLTIADDGIGFDVADAWGKGLGLISMAERLEAISGTLAIASTAGVGTRLEVRIPYYGSADAQVATA